MKKLSGLSATGKQTFTTTDENDNSITMTLYFRPAISMWFFDLSVGDHVINGMRLCNSKNILYQFENLLGFGLMVYVSDGYEPFLINDLSSGRVILYLLDQEDMENLDSLYEEIKEDEDG